MNLPPPNEILTLPKVQTAIRDNLNYFATQRPQMDFVIILDGANQTPDPTGLLSGLPGEILDNLYILISSQVQERVRKPLKIYTNKTWTLPHINAEAEAVVWHYWTQKISEQPTPECTDLPDNLLQKLCQTSHNVPAPNAYEQSGWLNRTSLPTKPRFIFNNIMPLHYQNFCKPVWRKFNKNLNQYVY